MLSTVLSRIALAAVPGAGPLLSVLVPIVAEAVIHHVTQRQGDIHRSTD
ncbi:MAG: hypothetical protein JSR83_23215 [Proteobacteria bacterium]|nr:hypothetical protein [Pseudomonadota bacterium]